MSLIIGLLASITMACSPVMVPASNTVSAPASAEYAADIASVQLSASDPEFDVGRARLSDTETFPPFYVETTRPLREALDEGVLNEDTAIVLMDHEAGRLTFILPQISFHHVAQGDMHGHPWLVSF